MLITQDRVNGGPTNIGSEATSRASQRLDAADASEKPSDREKSMVHDLVHGASVLDKQAEDGSSGKIAILCIELCPNVDQERPWMIDDGEDDTISTEPDSLKPTNLELTAS